jgi:hypothetical protein
MPKPPQPPGPPQSLPRPTSISVRPMPAGRSGRFIVVTGSGVEVSTRFEPEGITLDEAVSIAITEWLTILATADLNALP